MPPCSADPRLAVVTDEEAGMDARSDMRSDWQAEAGIRPPRPGERPTHWAGWLVFAGVMLAIVGLFEAMAGLTALFNDDYFVVPSASLVVSVDYTYWGWVHLALGAVALVAGYLLLRGNMVGRILATVIAGVNVVVHFVFLEAYPWWSVVAIAFNISVIYAITMHGAELKSRG
jgi:hypothetical protein